MLKRMRSFLMLAMLMLAVGVNAQITTATMSGKVTDTNNEVVVGATVLAVHEPSGARYGAITNLDGRYSIQGMKAGGPYRVEISYIGYQTVVFKDIYLQLGDNYVLNAVLKESSELLDEVIVTASANSNMKSDRAGAMTNVDAKQMAIVPTVTRSLTDMMRLSPQGSSTTSGFAVGGGNYRQSNVTIDGAQFNNTFGLGSGNLPGGGSPISLDALEQVSVSITPYDVRQSGFNGGAINAVTKSGTNNFNGTAYAYFTGNKLIGNNVNGSDFSLEDSHKYTYGASIGGPIVKDKLFFFVNGEYEDNIGAGPSARAGNGNEPYTNTNRRPTLDQLNSLTSYMGSTWGLTTGAWEGYNLKTPSYRILARVDWNINDDNKFNVRFTKSNRKANSGATSSRNPLNTKYIYNGGNRDYGSDTYYGMNAQSSRYYSEYRFISVAGELNSRFGKFTNMLRGTYSFQDQPRSNEFGNAPTVEIVMSDGQDPSPHFPTWALIGNDPFTMGNLSQTKNIVLTDEINAILGKHNLFAGFQYEYNHAVNGYAQMAAGYYAYKATPDQVANGDWASVFGTIPRVFAITYGNNAAHSMFQSKMSTHQYSLYLQDNMDLTENFKLSLGLRLELPIYPDLKNNFNQGYWNLKFGHTHYATDQVPDNSVSFSPRAGFNWDMSNGERKYVLRGGTGIFVGRMPFVWLISAVGNSGMGQTTYTYYQENPGNNVPPSFTMNQAEMLKQINASSSTTVPASPTILAEDLQMPKTWKASLAFDAKLPGDIDFTLEGIYNKDLNPCVVSNMNSYWDGTSTIELSNYDTRNYLSTYNPSNQAYVINNAGNKAYYWSINAQLRKQFDFGLSLSAAYTHSKAKSYTEGIGDQVTSAYTNYRNSINAVNDNETGYATYVAPNRVLFTASYKLKEGKNAASTFSLIYDGSENGFISGFSYSRFSYIFSSNVTNDYNAPGNLIFIPMTREDLNNWNFVDSGTYKDANGNKQIYTADMQRDDFWAYINQDSYLKNHKGQYAERGGAKMRWHHQIDFKFNQDFYLKIGKQKHTLQLGCDITNLPNLLNNKWGTYKQVISNSLLSYKKGNGTNGGNGTYTYNLANGARHLKTFQDYQSTWSTYQVLFSVRYLFN